MKNTAMKIQNFDYTTIKTFKDACLKIGADPEEFYRKYEGYPDHIKALIKLEVIIKALNDGWIYPLDGESKGYYPYFVIINDSFNDEYKDFLLGSKNTFAYIRPDGTRGYCYVCDLDNETRSGAAISYRLLCKTPEMAIYCGRQFKGLWASHLYPQTYLSEYQNDEPW